MCLQATSLCSQRETGNMELDYMIGVSTGSSGCTAAP
jgi:hypothetical protein